MNELVSDFDIFRFILWLCWACVWITLLGLGSLAVMGLIALYDWLRGKYIARRTERLLEETRTDILMRRAMKNAYSWGWLSDYKTRLTKFNEECE